MKSLLCVVCSIAAHILSVESKIKWYTIATATEKSGTFEGDPSNSVVNTNYVNCNGNVALCTLNSSLGYSWMDTTENDYNSDYCSSGDMYYCGNVTSPWSGHFWQGTAPICGAGCNGCKNGSVCLAQGTSGAGSICVSGNKILCAYRINDTMQIQEEEKEKEEKAKEATTNSRLYMEYGFFIYGLSQQQDEKLFQVIESSNLFGNENEIIHVLRYQYIKEMDCYGMNLVIDNNRNDEMIVDADSVVNELTQFFQHFNQQSRVVFVEKGTNYYQF